MTQASHDVCRSSLTAGCIFFLLGGMETKQNSPHLHCAGSHTHGVAGLILRRTRPSEEPPCCCVTGSGSVQSGSPWTPNIKEEVTVKNEQKTPLKAFSLPLTGSGSSLDKRCRASRPSDQLALFVLKGPPLSKRVFPRRKINPMDVDKAGVFSTCWANPPNSVGEVQTSAQIPWSVVPANEPLSPLLVLHNTF